MGIFDEIFQILRDGEYHDLFELDSKLPYQPRLIRRVLYFLENYDFIRTYRDLPTRLLLVRLDDEVLKFLEDIEACEHS